MILGVYGNDEKRPCGDFWYATFTVGDPHKGKIPMKVDFRGKDKDEKTMKADFMIDSKAIVWEDKNRWVPCYCNPKQFHWNGVGSSFMHYNFTGVNSRF